MWILIIPYELIHNSYMDNSLIFFGKIFICEYMEIYFNSYVDKGIVLSIHGLNSPYANINYKYPYMD